MKTWQSDTNNEEGTEVDRNQQRSELTFNNEMSERGNIQETYNIIHSSKRLIEEMENRNIANYNKSRSNLKSGRDPYMSKQQLSSKKNIEATIKSMKTNGTIAQEMLGNVEQKVNYLSVVENMLSYKPSKNRKKRNYNYEYEEQGKKRRKYYRQEVESAMRNVSVMGSANFNQNQPQQASAHIKSLEQNQYLKKFREEELQHIDRRLEQGRSTVKSDINSVNKNIPDEVSLKLGSRPTIEDLAQSNRNNLIDLDLSSSDSSDDEHAHDKTSHTANDYFSALSKQIDMDIQNCIAQSSRKTLADENSLNRSSVINSRNQNLTGHSEKEGTPIVYDSGATDSQDGHEDEHGDGDGHEDKNRKIDRQPRNTLVDAFKKNESGIYSFRVKENRQLDQLPTETENHRFSVKSEDISKYDKPSTTFHPDHGTGVSQERISFLLDSIRKRIQFSPIVIDSVKYEHCRENNNQLQIDSRYEKQSKERSELIHKITCFCEERKRFARCSLKRSVKYFEDYIMHDQSGKKSFVQGTAWRSPGKDYINAKSYVSLKSPILTGMSCCNYEDKNSTADSNWLRMALLESRNADTLKLSRSPNKNRKYKNNNSIDDSSIDQGRNEKESRELISRQTKNCIMRQNRWEQIKKIRDQLMI